MKFRFFLPLVLLGVCVVNAADVARPAIPANTFNIADYGAVPDGKSLNTQAIVKAIDACKSAGGGTVVIPAGKYATGPFNLISRMHLHFEDGATLIFTDDFAAYPISENHHRH